MYEQHFLAIHLIDSLDQNGGPTLSSIQPCCWLEKRNNNYVTKIITLTALRKVTCERGLEGDNNCFPEVKERVYRGPLPSNQTQYNSLQFPPLYSVYSRKRKCLAKQEMADYKTRKKELDYQIAAEKKV